MSDGGSICWKIISTIIAKFIPGYPGGLILPEVVRNKDGSLMGFIRYG